ncbi:thioredoxin family protein [Paraflavitalea pollutisoli]|uniref:thioredoxin family protein n=1 Tax=Paraflavitalea pollutisoli TaxID=3034143 RepID=UPI0023EBFE00|nr:thioredoxin family protein [Paraflavitalea sp. H1-2-19X]
MKQVSVLVFLLVATASLYAQDMKNFKLYNPTEDAEKALQQKIQEAGAGNKQVLVQIGGNWCVWCARFQEYTTKDATIDSLLKTEYVVYHLNYSPENKNEKLLAKYGFPQRFGFPVFLILDGKGNLLHIQDSGLLEEGKGYDKRKVLGFFNNWTAKAINPATYKQQ